VKKVGLALTTIVLIYLGYNVFKAEQHFWQGYIALALTLVVWIGPYLPKPQFFNGRTVVILALIYHVIRMAFNLVAMYLLFTYKFLNIYEILIGYFILLLISFLSIKNERNFRSQNQ
jgi:hypothetical protein